jgi:chromosome segregation ATPase
MLKKGLLVGAGVVLVLGLVFGRSGISYVKTAFSDIRSTVDDSIPTEMKIKEARDQVGQLDGMINKLAREIALEETKINRLNDDLATEQAKLEKEESHIKTLTSHLQSGNSVYVVKTQRGTKNFSQEVVESDLRSCFANFKTNKATVEKMSQIIDAREKGLDAAKENYEATKIARRELEVQIENLQARLKMVEVAKTTSSFHHDDSQLARTRELIDNIESRIQVEETLSQMQPTETRIPRADEVEAETGDIVEQVTTYFSNGDTHFVAEK